MNTPPYTHTHTHTALVTNTEWQCSPKGNLRAFTYEHTPLHTHTEEKHACLLPCPPSHRLSLRMPEEEERLQRTQPSTLAMRTFPLPSDAKRFIATSIHYATHAV